MLQLISATHNGKITLCEIQLVVKGRLDRWIRSPMSSTLSCLAKLMHLHQQACKED